MNNIEYSTPTETFVSSIDIHTLLPQQEPFVMIGKITHFDMKFITTKTTVKESNIFVDNRIMQPGGLIENIAQTCAARIGYINKYILKKGIQIGFIGSLRNLSIESLPKVDDEITTEVEIKEEILGMILASATVKKDDTILVSTDIKIAIKEE